uniref:Uncharacterized protein n=1 Tax=Anopheles atroparvus TaxID=41427 RepID=A0AAG5DWB0_ANOAO
MIGSRLGRTARGVRSCKRKLNSLISFLHHQRRRWLEGLLRKKKGPRFPFKWRLQKTMKCRRNM